MRDEVPRGSIFVLDRPTQPGEILLDFQRRRARSYRRVIGSRTDGRVTGLLAETS
jgi:hypothetical protein